MKNTKLYTLVLSSLIWGTFSDNLFANGEVPPYTPPVYQEGMNFYWSEDFEYNKGGNIPEKSGGKWSIKNEGDAPIIVEDNLWTALIGDSYSKGNAISLQNNSMRGLESELFANNSQMTEGKLYLSMLINVKKAYLVNTDQPDSPDFVTGGEKLTAMCEFLREKDETLGLGSGGNGQVYAKAVNETNYKLGVTRFGLNKSNPNAFYAEDLLEYGKTYHLVVKMEYVDNGMVDGKLSREESIKLFINPSENIEPTKADAEQVSPISKVASAINAFSICQDTSSPDVILDCIRIASSWEKLELPIVSNIDGTGKNNEWQAYIENGILVLRDLNIKESVTVYTLDGNIIQDFKAKKNEYRLGQLDKNIYLIRHHNVVKKVIF